MSYILDALRKAERDRQTTPVPTIDAVHAPLLVERTIRYWPWLVAGALAVNAMVLVAVFRPRHAEVPVAAGPTTAPAVVPATPPHSVARPSPEPAPAPATPAPRAAVGDGAAVTKGRRTEQTDVPPAAPSRAPERPVMAAVPKTAEPAHEAEPSPRTEAPKASPAEPTTPSVKREPPAPPPGEASGSAVAPRARADMAPAKRTDAAAPAAPPRRTEAAAAPALQDLPATFRENAPNLRLEVLLYSDAPAERMVFINGRKYREGDTIEGKAVVETIVREGAVLSYQGQRYLLRE